MWQREAILIRYKTASLLNVIEVSHPVPGSSQTAAICMHERVCIYLRTVTAIDARKPARTFRVRGTKE